MHAVLFILATAFVLGLVHGITPDEHTWPITFSYAIGSYSARRGLFVGLLFSLAFTFERALGSEASYLALGHLFTQPTINDAVYLAVGLAMMVAGAYILRFDQALHVHLVRRSHARHRGVAELEGRAPAAPYRAPNPFMAIIHGFIAGFGFGAFALVLYTSLAPAMPNAYVAWMPGAAFGLGTTVVQALAGAAFGSFVRRRGLGEQAVERVAHHVAGHTLTWGGLVFALAGVLTYFFPVLALVGLRTGVNVPNLDSLGLGFALVMITVMVVGMGSLWAALRRERRRAQLPPSASPGHPSGSVVS